jgi:hypothetical protein
MADNTLSNAALSDHLSDLAETLADWAALHGHIDVLQLASERLKVLPLPTPLLPVLVKELRRLAHDSQDSRTSASLFRLLGSEWSI